MTTPRIPRRRLATLAQASLLAVVAAPVASACTAPGSDGAAHRTTGGAPAGRPASPTAGTAVAEPQRVASGRLVRPLTPAELVLDRMSPAQVVGQVFMVGTPAAVASAATRAQVGSHHVGNVMLTGRSDAGTRAPARVAATMQAAATARATRGVPLLVSTDQEGGAVQVLRGRGFSTLPSGLTQGQWRPAALRAAAARWGRELRAAGVTMNLAPVLDTVPGPAAAAGNPPIGVFGRQYGYAPGVVAAAGLAFARGMSDAGVVPTVKHFPGLGRVAANPDVSTGVTDRVTGRRDPYLEPFRRAVDGGLPVVMMSTAYYPRLDAANPAAFSRTIIERVLRADLGFRGVVISDDLGNARQVAGFPAGARAVRFLAAGGDLVLTVNPATLPAMHRAVLQRTRSRPAFRDRVEQAALRVLRIKQERGLLRP